MFFYQFMHSFESILGVRKNFHSIYPSNVYTHFFSKTSYDQQIFLHIKVGNYLFSQACCFLARQLFIFIIFVFFSSFFFFSYLLFFPFPFFFIICSFPLSSFFFSLFLSEKVVRTRAHTTYLRLTTR